MHLCLPLQGLHGRCSSNFDNILSNFHHDTYFRTIVPIIWALKAVSKVSSVYGCVRPSSLFIFQIEVSKYVDVPGLGVDDTGDLVFPLVHINVDDCGDINCGNIHFSVPLLDSLRG